MSHRLLIGALPALLLGCPKDKDTDPKEPIVTWDEAFDTRSTGSLSGVWGSGPDDVFVVGGTEEGGEVYHYDGTNWSPMELPDGLPLLVWAYGFGPSDVFAVGVDGAAAHYDGSEWTAMDAGTTEDLWGVFGFTRNDLWIVGGDPDVGEPLILHYDGSDFETVPVEENSRAATTLFKVWGIDSTLFIVGQRGLILKWDGRKWRESPGGANADQDLISLWGTSEDHIVAVGGRGNGRIATWDGAAWDTIAPSRMSGINAVWMGDPDQAHIGGFHGFVGTYDPGDDSFEDEGRVGEVDVHAMWGDGQGRIYAVGGNFLPPHRGSAHVRTETMP